MKLRHALLILFFAALSVRVVYCWTLSPYRNDTKVEDIDNYHKFARSLRADFSYSLQGQPRASREPGYPIFLTHQVVKEAMAVIGTAGNLGATGFSDISELLR